jgi:glycosyltransferase involved in cell wall biosynthesis
VSTPELTFVVLSFDYGRYLGACVDSILAQDGFDDFEVVIVDDASSDDSLSIARAYVEADRRIRLVGHAFNQGHGATVTDGLRLARGIYVARIDCDDRYRRGLARAAVSILEREPGVGLVYGDAALIDDAGRVTLDRSDRVHNGRDFKGNELVSLLQENFICAPTVVARRDVWLDSLPIPNGLAFHDWYFTLMAARRHDFYFSSQVLAEYRVHAANYHKRIVRERAEEGSIVRLLDKVFSEVEVSPTLEGQKQRVRRRAYAAQYLRMADKYFGFGMDTDARRCYLRALGYEPRFLVRPDVVRRLLATVTGRRTYELSKSVARAALAAARTNR